MAVKARDELTVAEGLFLPENLSEEEAIEVVTQKAFPLFVGQEGDVHLEFQPIKVFASLLCHDFEMAKCPVCGAAQRLGTGEDEPDFVCSEGCGWSENL